LGNVLRIVLSGHSDVEFVGYSIPHPSEAKMNLRLQTQAEDSNDVLNEGLKTVQSVTKDIRSKFQNSLKEFKKSQK
jgi:DNA-directed RNA polymerases I and III subunit RPAC2